VNEHLQSSVTAEIRGSAGARDQVCLWLLPSMLSLTARKKKTKPVVKGTHLPSMLGCLLTDAFGSLR